MVEHAITAREQSRIVAALRSTTQRVPQIAADFGRSSVTIKRIAEAHGITLAGRS